MILCLSIILWLWDLSRMHKATTSMDAAPTKGFTFFLACKTSSSKNSCAAPDLLVPEWSCENGTPALTELVRFAPNADLSWTWCMRYLVILPVESGIDALLFWGLVSRHDLAGCITILSRKLSGSQTWCKAWAELLPKSHWRCITLTCWSTPSVLALNSWFLNAVFSASRSASRLLSELLLCDKFRL